MGINELKKFILAVILLIVFVLISIQCINKPMKTRRSEFRSSELNQVVTKNGNVIRMDYTDDDGNLRIAANYGYASKLIVQQKNTEIETYLDDCGEQISMYAGYYGVLREYDAMGNNIRVTYLDANNAPIVMALKYAVEEKDFDEFGRQVFCRYFDVEGKPALSYNNGFGVHYEYDEKGQKVRITYLDDKGQPMIISSGYSILTREYYETDGPEKGKVKKEHYYLPDGMPASLSLGQYGVYKEYDENGQNSLITYLGADGVPMITKKGYTSVAYTYYADNTVQSTFYYDINGNPFRLDEGQYGIKDVNGQTIYLDADGKEQFNIKNFAYYDSRFVIIIVIMLVILSAFAEKKVNWLMLITYTGVIAYFTLMFREMGESKIGILRSYSGFFASASIRADILKNIWLFIPMGGILFKLCSRKIILLLPVSLSIIVETIQYFTGLGLCELDDVISNGLGGIIGYGMGGLVQMIRNTIVRKKIIS